jgi:microcystin-dependent protein
LVFGEIMTKVLTSIKLPVSTQAVVEAGSYPAGSIYYDNTNKVVRYYDGSLWNTLTSGGAIDMPIGSIQQWLGATAPSGWLICNGQAVSRSTYSSLFSIISTRFGTGDGSTTFNVPDLRGYQVTGTSASVGNVDNTSTFRQGTVDAGSIATHSGTAALHSHTLTYTASNETQHDIGHSHSATVSEGTVTLTAHTYSDTSNGGQSHTHTASNAAGASASATSTGQTRASAAHTHAAPSVSTDTHTHTVSTSSWSAHSAHRHSPVFSGATTGNTASASPTSHNHTPSPSTDGSHTHTDHSYKTHYVHYIIKAA